MEPMNKALKKRDNKKLDYERYLKEVEHMKKKRTRTDRSVSGVCVVMRANLLARENAVFAKAEANLEAATVVRDLSEKPYEFHGCSY